MSHGHIATVVAADGFMAGLLVAVVGIAAGRLLTSAVGHLVEPLPRGRRLLDRAVVVAVAAAAVATWWW